MKYCATVVNSAKLFSVQASDQSYAISINDIKLFYVLSACANKASCFRRQLFLAHLVNAEPSIVVLTVPAKSVPASSAAYVIHSCAQTPRISFLRANPGMPQKADLRMGACFRG